MAPICKPQNDERARERMKRMRRCSACGAYTLDELHCGSITSSPHPPKYSADDRYAKYRRQSLKETK